MSGGIDNCGPIISSAGDSCFAAGELEDGFDGQSSVDNGGGDIIAIGAGNIGNSIDIVGANTFAEYTIFNFSPHIFAFGIDIWNNSDPITEVRVYDADGNILDSFVLNNTIAAEDFFGLIADEPISKIEIEEANAGGELMGNMVFGDCPVLGVGDNIAELVSVFPNPATDVLNIQVETVAKYK